MERRPSAGCQSDQSPHAKVAETELRKFGAKTTLKTYQGGHGWRDDPFGNIRTGIKWLEANAAK